MHVAQNRGRTLRIHLQADLWQRLKVLPTTVAGRAALRERVAVEHGLAPVSQRQGNEARYGGTRKHTRHLRLVCAIQNLERAQTLTTQAANDAKPFERLTRQTGQRARGSNGMLVAILMSRNE